MSTVNNLLRTVVQLPSWLLFSAIAALIPFYAVWEHFVSLKDVAVYGLLATCLYAGAVNLLGRTFYRTPTGARSESETSTRTWLWFLLVLGCALRIFYFFSIPEWERISDEVDYISLAKNLIETGEYRTDYGDQVVLRAFRPPGFPLFLAPIIALFGDSQSVFLFTNTVLFALTLPLVFLLGKRIADEQVGLVASFLFTIWPSSIMYAGQGMSEPLGILIYTLAIYAFLKSQDSRDRFKWSIVAGLVLGVGALVKSSLMLLPTAFLPYLLVRTKARKRRWLSWLILVLVMVAVISPWTYRNYIHTGGFIPISSNGGTVFYRANNPNASGGFTNRGEKDLDSLLHDELLWYRTGMQWGKDWIKNNPLEFLELVLHKQRIFLSNDPAGPYYTYSRYAADGRNGYSESAGRILYFVADTWWFALWILIACSLLYARSLWLLRPDWNLLLWSCLYLITVHSVFESQPRYHFPIVGLLCLIAAFGIIRRNEPETNG